MERAGLLGHCGGEGRGLASSGLDLRKGAGWAWTGASPCPRGPASDFRASPWQGPGVGYVNLSVVRASSRPAWVSRPLRAKPPPWVAVKEATSQRTPLGPHVPHPTIDMPTDQKAWATQMCSMTWPLSLGGGLPSLSLELAEAVTGNKASPGDKE